MPKSVLVAHGDNLALTEEVTTDLDSFLSTLALAQSLASPSHRSHALITVLSLLNGPLLPGQTDVELGLEAVQIDLARRLQETLAD